MVRTDLDGAGSPRFHPPTAESEAVAINLAPNWYEHMFVAGPVLEKNAWMRDKTISEIAQTQGKGIIDAFLDLVVEEKLGTVIRHATGN